MFRGLLLVLAVFMAEAGGRAFEPVSAYRATNVAGFRVLLSAGVLEHGPELWLALEEFEAQAKRIEGVVDPGVFRFLRSVPVWLEWQAKTNGAAEYHPSRDWLAANGYLPSKAKGIEINNARNFVKWSRNGQPWMLLHELAHAFHDQVLGWDDAGVLGAFEKARASGNYENVKHVNGRTVRSYALTDEKEYFAELSEAYLGRNDFYPFDRAELETFDKAGFAMVAKKWKRRPAGEIPAATGPDAD